MTQALHPRGNQPKAVQYAGNWTVIQLMPSGEPCMTVFSGPWAEWRARQYARAETLSIREEGPAA